jgi:hypothetical protein
MSRIFDDLVDQVIRRHPTIAPCEPDRCRGATIVLPLLGLRGPGFEPEKEEP